MSRRALSMLWPWARSNVMARSSSRSGMTMNPVLRGNPSMSCMTPPCWKTARVMHAADVRDHALREAYDSACGADVPARDPATPAACASHQARTVREHLHQIGDRHADHARGDVGADALGNLPSLLHADRAQGSGNAAHGAPGAEAEVVAALTRSTRYTRGQRGAHKPVPAAQIHAAAAAVAGVGEGIAPYVAAGVNGIAELVEHIASCVALQCGPRAHLPGLQCARDGPPRTAWRGGVAILWSRPRSRPQ